VAWVALGFVAVGLVALSCSGSTPGSTSEVAEAPPTGVRSPPVSPVPTATAVVAVTAAPASTLAPTSTVDGDPAPGRPSAAGDGRVDENPAWLGREGMREDALELVWAADTSADVTFELHRIDAAEVDEPDVVEVGPTSLVHDGPDQRYVDTDVIAGGQYFYVLVAELASGEVFRRWAELHAVTDTTPPDSVGEVTLAETADGLLLSWNRSRDDYRFARYAIRRSVGGAASVYYGTGWTIEQTSFLDDQPPAQGTVRYEVIAVDFHGNTSEPSVVVLQR